MYQEVLVLALRRHRPDAEVVLAKPDDIERVAESFEPDLVVGSRISTLLRETVRAWVELAARDGLCAEVSVGGRRAEIMAVGIEDLLRIPDERRSWPTRVRAVDSYLYITSKPLHGLARKSHSTFLETVIGCLDNPESFGLARVPGCGGETLDEHSG